MAQILGNVAVGTTLYVNENGTPQPYIVVNQGIPQDSSLYDESCNGTWLLRKDIYANANWNSSNVNAYGPSDVNTNYLPNIILPLYDNDFQNAIKQVKIPYVNGTGSSPVASGSSGLSTKIFLLSGYEVGFSTSDNSYLPVDGAKLSYFDSGTGTTANNKRIANYNNLAVSWWLRSPRTNYTNYTWNVISTGNIGNSTSSYSLGIRPAMIMPTNLIVDDNNNILSQTFTITVPQIFMEGQSIPISWTPWTSSTGGTITYTIERNTGSGWTQVATGLSVTSYSDTAQSGWTSVQYQITPVVDGVNGPSVQSDVIPGAASAVLAISGIDGDLGTITSNIQYTVVSNTGNPISLTRTVNGAQVVTIQVNSGFSYSIPIADLPTGTGTIIITASVEDSSQEIQTATRTWTYYKTPINIPSTGGIAQLTQNGQNIWPVTVPDAVEAPVYLGGNLNAALNKLGQAALYTKIGNPKYSEVTVDLSKASVGDEVNLPYNGVMVPHIVVQIGNPDVSMYDASCDGVWLLRKDCVETGQWNSTNVNTLAGSTIMTTMAGYVSQYDSSVSSEIKTVKIPYCIGGGNTTVQTLGNGLECQIFSLGGYEVGWTQSNNQYFPVDGAKLSYFTLGTTTAANNKRIANYNGSPSWWWLRSPYTYNNQNAFKVDSDGSYASLLANGTTSIRPCFILPTTFTATYYVDSLNNVYPSQEYTTGGSITDVFGYDVPICQYEVGSYVGTGTYGSSNPNTLTFSFEPKFFCIVGSGENLGYIRAIFPYGGYGILANVMNSNSSTMSIFGIAATWTSNSISWYNTSLAALQLNAVDTTYQYFAIG